MAGGVHMSGATSALGPQQHASFFFFLFASLCSIALPPPLDPAPSPTARHGLLWEAASLAPGPLVVASATPPAIVPNTVSVAHSPEHRARHRLDGASHPHCCASTNQCMPVNSPCLSRRRASQSSRVPPHAMSCSPWTHKSMLEIRFSKL